MSSVNLEVEGVRKKVLVTGATGKTGSEVVKLLRRHNEGSSDQIDIVIATRNIQRARNLFDEFTEDARISFVQFDLNVSSTFERAVAGVHSIYLVAPRPSFSTPKMLRPLWQAVKNVGVKHVTFLSNAANEFSDQAPHAVIEQDIRQAAKDNSMTWTFLRAEYFMQNLLRDNAHGIDIREFDEIYCPASDGVIPWIDDRDVAAVAALTLLNTENHVNCTYLLTGPELLTYAQVASILSEELGRTIRYTSAWSIPFAYRKYKQNVEWDFILVQCIIFAMVRTGKGARTTDTLALLLGRPPTSIKQFVHEMVEQGYWKKLTEPKLQVSGFD